jgi:hypothetical protein
MTLPSSPNSISLAQIQTEFGGVNPIGLDEYYGVASGVPASGTISLYDFYGKSSYNWAVNEIQTFTDYIYAPYSTNSRVFTSQTFYPPAGSYNLILTNFPITYSPSPAYPYMQIIVDGSVRLTDYGSSNDYTLTVGEGSYVYFRFTVTMQDSTYNNGPVGPIMASITYGGSYVFRGYYSVDRKTAP